MKKHKKSKPQAQGLSPEINALAEEIGGSLPALLQDPRPLLERLESLSSGGQEELFRLLSRQKAGEIPSLLRKLAESATSAPLKKIIRKSLFQLRSRGIEVPQLTDSAPSIYHPPPPAPPEGYLSTIDGAGTRMVFLTRPQAPQGILAWNAVVSDVQGIVDFSGFETSRKKFHEYLDDLRGRMAWDIVEGDSQYSLGLILQAAEANQKKGQPLPEEFLKWKALLGSPPDPLPPLIYRFLSGEEMKTRSDLLDRSVSLFEISPFRDWFLEEAETEKYLPLLQEASESRLVLTPYQKEARVLEIYRQAVNELFDSARRSLFRRRLEEMAYILWKKGEEEAARISLAAGLQVESEGGVLSVHPFLLELVKRSLTARVEEEAEKKKKEPGLIETA